MDITHTPESPKKSPLLAGLLGLFLGGPGLFYLSAAHGVTWLVLYILSMFYLAFFNFGYVVGYPNFLFTNLLTCVLAVLCLKFPHYFSFMDRINTFLGDTLPKRIGMSLAILMVTYGVTVTMMILLWDRLTSR